MNSIFITILLVLATITTIKGASPTRWPTRAPTRWPTRALNIYTTTVYIF